MPSELSVCSGLVVELESHYFLQLTVELQTNLHQILYYKHFEDRTVVNLPFSPLILQRKYIYNSAIPLRALPLALGTTTLYKL